MNRPIDKTKKSNIKCEHCKYYIQPESIYSNAYCRNDDSPKFDTTVNYWNRCKKFEWADKYKENKE